MKAKMYDYGIVGALSVLALILVSGCNTYYGPTIKGPSGTNAAVTYNTYFPTNQPLFNSTEPLIVRTEGGQSVTNMGTVNLSAAEPIQLLATNHLLIPDIPPLRFSTNNPIALALNTNSLLTVTGGLGPLVVTGSLGPVQLRMSDSSVTTYVQIVSVGISNLVPSTITVTSTPIRIEGLCGTAKSFDTNSPESLVRMIDDFKDGKKRTLLIPVICIIIGGSLGRCFVLQRTWDKFRGEFDTDLTGLLFTRYLFSNPFSIPLLLLAYGLVTWLLWQEVHGPDTNRASKYLLWLLFVPGGVVGFILLAIPPFIRLTTEMVRGMCAALLLLPFQHLMKLDLIGDSSQDAMAIVMLFGFCFLAAMVGDRFIKSVVRLFTELLHAAETLGQRLLDPNKEVEKSPHDYEI